MTVEEIFNWVQDNGAIICIKQGPHAIETIIENGGIDAWKAVRFTKDGVDNGLEGYWVEIALNDDCAGWSYSAKLNNAINSAFDAMIEFAREAEYMEKDSFVLIPGDGQSWIGQHEYNFATGDIEFKNMPRH